MAPGPLYNWATETADSTLIFLLAQYVYKLRIIQHENLPITLKLLIKNPTVI